MGETKNEDRLSGIDGVRMNAARTLARPAKRERALLGSDPPRNSRPKTRGDTPAPTRDALPAAGRLRPAVDLSSGQNIQLASGPVFWRKHDLELSPPPGAGQQISDAALMDDSSSVVDTFSLSLVGRISSSRSFHATRRKHGIACRRSAKLTSGESLSASHGRLEIWAFIQYECRATPKRPH